MFEVQEYDAKILGQEHGACLEFQVRFLHRVHGGPSPKWPSAILPPYVIPLTLYQHYSLCLVRKWLYVLKRLASGLVASVLCLLDPRLLGRPRHEQPYGEATGVSTKASYQQLCEELKEIPQPQSVFKYCSPSCHPDCTFRRDPDLNHTAQLLPVLTHRDHVR